MSDYDKSLHRMSDVVKLFSPSDMALTHISPYYPELQRERIIKRIDGKTGRSKRREEGYGGMVGDRTTVERRKVKERKRRNRSVPLQFADSAMYVTISPTIDWPT